MTTTQTLALAYAEKLVAYYETINNRDENRIAYMETLKKIEYSGIQFCAKIITYNFGPCQ